MSVRTWAQRPKERRSKAPTIIQRDRAIEKGALVESAERIYLRYLLGGAEKEIYLPYVHLSLYSCPFCLPVTLPGEAPKNWRLV